MNPLVRPPLKTLLWLLLSFAAAQACGPDFSPDVFVRPGRPDLPADFVKGKLALLQPGYPRADLLVAYRYLAGGTLDEVEQHGWTPTYSPLEPVSGYARTSPDASATAVAAWLLARGRYRDVSSALMGEERTITHPAPYGGQYRFNFVNCADDAFTTATATLVDRAGRWGAQSPYVRNWLQAQDAVFENCSAGAATPTPAPPGSPSLLLQDRAYQLAAASFYSLSFPKARQQFMAISSDKSSPWQPIAGYLVARALIRQAFFVRSDPSVADNYDPALMKAAALQLRGYLAGAPPAPLRRAAQAELALALIRIEPDRRARELSALVSGPAHDSDYAQDAQDLLWFIDQKTPAGLRAQPDPDASLRVEDEQHPGHMRMFGPQAAKQLVADKRHQAYAASSALRALSPVIDWTLTTQSLDPAAADHALAEWRRSHSVPWLVAALMLAPDGAAPSQPLLAAAAALPESSPAWQTATYHRVRLLLASGNADEARTILAHALLRIRQQAEPSSLNAFRSLAMQAAPDLAGFLAFAPRQVLLANSEEESSLNECRSVMHDPERHYHCFTESSPDQLDADAARTLNEQAPLRVWLLAAESNRLGSQLREAIAAVGWTRAVLLQDVPAAVSFLPLLPPALRAEAGQGAGLQQLLVLAQNPGLTPYLNSGVQRFYSYDFVESYRDNWCYKPADEEQESPIAFLTPQELLAGREQARTLGRLRSADLAQQIVDAVQGDPSAASAPEALYLVLRMVRYGCTEAAAPPPPQTASPAAASPYVMAMAPPPSAEALHLFRVKQQAARLLRHRYTGSPWTRKAAPLAG